MVELAFRGKKREPEPKKKNYLPYGILAALAALIILLPFLGFLSQGSSIQVTEQVTIAREPTMISEPFTCKSDLQLLSEGKFAFDTNSDVRDVKIDRVSRMITLDVSGPEESIGTLCINVPKDFISTKELQATIDNLPLNARLKEFPNSTIVILEYHHSERTIRIFGQEEPMEITPVTESVVAVGVPVVFSPGEQPEVSNAAGSGNKVQIKTRAIVNFMSDIGERVEVKFKIDNLSQEDALVMIQVLSSDSLLVDLVESGDVDKIRPISNNAFLVEVQGGAKKAELIANVISIDTGFQPFIIEILPPKL